ncbi:MAG: xylulokinase [Candidatus Ornithospirochaeta sp.]
MLVAGIDCGTQSIKVLVYDSERKREVAVSSSPLPLISRPDGSREQKARWYIDGLKKCFGEIESEIRRDIRAISVSGQQHGFVPIDECGSVLHDVKLWCDTSTALECREIEEAYGGREKVMEEVGNPILPGYTASKILWLKKNHRDEYENMRYVLLPHDYINHYLTGKVVMERGDASGTGLLDIRRGIWHKGICDVVSPSLVDKLPPIWEGLPPIGTLTERASVELGLGLDVAVAPGGGDNMMSAIGTGAVKDGEMTISLGTSGTLFASSSRPLIDKEGRLAAFFSSHGTYLPLLCTMNCTVAEEVLRKEMGLSVEEFVGEAEKAPIGSEGLLLLPFFNGERVPDYPKGEALLGGMNMTNVKRSNIARAAVEGVSFGFLLGLEAFRELSFSPTVVSLTGGGAKSAFWRQMISDVTNLETRCPKTSEAAAYGAALQAIASMEGRSIPMVVEEHLEYDEEKKCVPNTERHDEYMAAYAKWKRYSDVAAPLFR